MRLRPQWTQPAQRMSSERVERLGRAGEAGGDGSLLSEQRAVIAGAWLRAHVKLLTFHRLLSLRVVLGVEVIGT